MLLGLKANVPAVITSHKETRFGITLEKEDLSNVAGSLTIKPQSSVNCNLLIRRNRFSDPIVFKGDVILAPSLLDINKIGGLHFKSKILTFTAKISEEKFSINLRTVKLEESTLMSPDEWVKFFSLAQAISRDGFSLSLEPEGLDPLSLPDARALLEIEEDVVAFDIENAKRLRRLVEMAGALDYVQITYSEICQQADNISSGFSILNNAEEISPLSFQIVPHEHLPAIPDSLEGMHVNFVCCGKDLIVWSAAVILDKTTEGKIIKFASKSVSLEELRKIPVEKYFSFVEQVREKVGAGVLMAREL